LLVQVEIDTLAVQLAKEPNQLLQRSAEAINRPSRDEIEFAPGNALTHTIVARPLVAPLSAADSGIDKGSDEIPIVPLGDGLKFTLLVLDGLFCRGHSQVEGDPLCHGDHSAS
jgi:hypothetical protein